MREKDCRAQRVCLASLGAEKTSHSDEQSPQNGIGSKLPQIGVFKIKNDEHVWVHSILDPRQWFSLKNRIPHKVPLNPVAYHHYPILSYIIMVLSYIIIYYHILSYIIIYYHILSYIIIYYHILSYIIIYYHILSYIIIYYHILSYIIIYYHILSYIIIYYHILSYIIIYYHILSYIIIYYHILS